MTLHHLAMTGDLVALRDALAGGTAIESRDEHGQTPLMAAASANQAEAIRVLLQAGARPDACSEPRDLGRGETPAGSPGEVAVRHGLLEVIAPIVGGQAPVKQKRTTADGPSALMIAAALGHAEAVEALLAGGALVDLRERDAFSALSYASALGHAGLVRRLLKAGAEVNQVDHYNMKPVVLAALFGRAEAVRALCEAGANPSPTDPWNYGALHAASSHGHAETVRVLAASGADLNETCYGRTPLQLALSSGHAEVVEVLTASPEAARNAPDHSGITPLMRAVAKRELGTLQALLRSGADPSATVKGEGEGRFSTQSLPSGASALHLAACLDDPAFATALTNAGAPVHDQDSLGFSPLMLAVASGNDETATAIRGAAPPSDADRKTLLDFDLVASVRRGDLRRVRGLLGAGASPTVKIPNTFKYHYLVRCEAAGDDWGAALNIGGTAGPGSFKDAGRPVLSLALELGHDAIARELVRAGADITDMAQTDFGGSGRTPLFEAAENGRDDLLRDLIAAGADVNVRDAHQHTPLMLAVRGGHAEIARVLIAAGADVNARTGEKERALSLAIESSNDDLVRILLEAGARPRPEDPSHAALVGKVECTRLLLDACRDHDVTPAADLLENAVWSNSPELVGMLIDAGLDVNAGTGFGPPLVTACQRSAELLRMLIDAGADVNAARNDQGHTALSSALLFGSIDHVRLLLEHGADPNSLLQDENFPGQTLLMQVCGSGPATHSGGMSDPEKRAAIVARDETIVGLLLEHGADVNARDRDGRTALMLAAEKHQASLVRLLLAAGADVQVVDTRHGRTALHWAAVGGNPEVVRLLLAAGADRSAADLDGRTPHAITLHESKPKVEPLLRFKESDAPPRRSPVRSFREAVESGDVKALRAALRDGADPNVPLSGGRTGLTVSVESNRLAVARALLEAGADPNVADGESRTPLLIAIESGNLEIVRSLLDAGADPNGPGRMHGGGRTTPLIFAVTSRGIMMSRSLRDAVEGSRSRDPYPAIVRALLAAGASPDVEDEAGVRPLWYALDIDEDELADLLIEAGAGKDSLSQAYLEARSMPERAVSEAFQAVVREVAAICGSEPKPLTGRPSRFEWLQSRSRTQLPTGPTLGVLFSVTGETAEALIAAHQDEFRKRGAFLLLNSPYTGEFNDDRPQLGLLAASSWEVVLPVICSPGDDWDWVCPAFYIRDLRAIAADYPFRLIACESRSLQLEFLPPLSDPDDLAARLGAIRTRLWAPNLPEYPEDEDVAEALRQHRRISFFWE
jgi:ankyrin repeat protein